MSSSWNINLSLTPELEKVAKSLAVAEVQNRFVSLFHSSGGLVSKPATADDASSTTASMHRAMALRMKRARSRERAAALDRRMCAIDKMRAEHAADLASAEAQIAAGVHAQVGVLDKSTQLIARAGGTFLGIKEAFSSVTKEVGACREVVHSKDCQDAVRLKRARNNLKTVLRLLNVHGSVPRRIAALERIIRSDESMLYDVFVEWHKMQSLRKKILEQLDAKPDGNAARLRQRGMLKGMKEVVGDHFQCVFTFGQKLWGLIFMRVKRALDIAPYEPGHLTAAAMAIEFADNALEEERMRLQKRLEANGCDPAKADAMVPSKKMKAECLHTFEARARERLDALVPLGGADRDEEATERTSAAAFVDGATTLLFDLRVLAEDVARCFPPHYDILGIHLEWYNARFSQRLAQLTGGGDGDEDDDDDTHASPRRATRRSNDVEQSDALSCVTNSDILLLLGWVDQYDEEVARLNCAGRVSKSVTRSADKLAATYLTRALSRMRQWLRVIVERRDSVALHNQRCYTVAPEDVFSFLDQDARVVCTDGCVRGSYLARYVRECVALILREFTAHLRTRVDVAEVDFLCAAVNDCSRSQELCADLVAFISNHLKGSNKESALNVGEAAQNDFLRLAVRCVQRMADIIMESLDCVFGNLFGGDWESGASLDAAKMSETFADYFQDPEQGVREWMQDQYYFGKLVALIVERTIAAYLKRLTSVKGVFASVPRAAARMRADAKKLQSCFCEYLDDLKFGAIRDKQALSSRFSLIELAADFLSNPSRQDTMDEISGLLGNATTPFLRGLLPLAANLDDCGDLVAVLTSVDVKLLPWFGQKPSSCAKKIVDFLAFPISEEAEGSGV